MGNKLHSSQIQTGISPGDIPVYTNHCTLISTGLPIDQNDVVNKHYLDSQLLNITNQGTLPTPLNDFSEIITRLEDLKLYVSNNYVGIADFSELFNNQIHNYTISNNIRIEEIENNYTNFMNKISEVRDYVNNKTQTIYAELSELSALIEKINATTISANVLVIEKTLDELKRDYKSKIDQYCANFLNYEVVYKEKFEQAVDFMMQPNSDVSAFPLLVLDTTIYNIDIQEAAERIIQKRKQWLQYMTQIERLRLTTKQNIDSAIEKEYINNLYLDFEQNIQLLTNG
jgi:hypothetical protein